MEIRVTVKQGKPREIQRVTGTLRDVRFQQSASWVVVENAICERVDFSKHKFDPLAAGTVRFVECNFSRSRLSYSTLGPLGSKDRQALYRDCRFDRADMRHMPHIGNARFERCSFRETRMEGWRADWAEFIDCAFSGRMYDCRFAGRPWSDEDGATRRERNEFTGNDFREAELDGVMFVYGIDLDAQLLPESDRYLRLDRPVERLDRVRAQIARWPQDDVREYGLLTLRMVDGAGDREQRSLWIDRPLFASQGRFPGVSERILAMLEHALD